MTKEFELCKSIAISAHKTQERRGGEHYINHPLRVAEILNNDTLKCIAVLHDVMEDCCEDEKSLLAKGVDVAIVDGVSILTKRRGQLYDDYISGIKKFPGLARVKIADMFDNLCSEPTERQKQKYRNAMVLLSSCFH